ILQRRQQIGRGGYQAGVGLFFAVIVATTGDRNFIAVGVVNAVRNGTAVFHRLGCPRPRSVLRAHQHNLPISTRTGAPAFHSRCLRTAAPICSSASASSSAIPAKPPAAHSSGNTSSPVGRIQPTRSPVSSSSTHLTGGRLPKVALS